MTTTESTRTTIDDGSPDVVQEMINATIALLRKYFPEFGTTGDMERISRREQPLGPVGLRYISVVLSSLAEKTRTAAMDESEITISAAQIEVHHADLLRLERELNIELELCRLSSDIARLAIALPDSPEPQKILAQILDIARSLLNSHRLTLPSKWETDLEALDKELRMMLTAEYGAVA